MSLTLHSDTQPPTLAKVLFIFTLSIFVSGCYSLPSLFSEPATSRDLPYLPPEGWSTSPQRTHGESIHSPMKPSQYFGSHFPGFDYSSIIEAALEGSYALRQLDSQLESQIARHGAEKSKLWPSITAGLNGQRTNIDDSTSKIFTLQGDVSWAVDLWGSQRLIADSAKNSVEESLLSREAGQFSIAAASLQSWFDWSSKKKLLQLQTDFVSTLQTSTKLVENRFNDGLASLLGVRLAHTEIALARSDLLQKRSATIEARTRFLELLGESHDNRQENNIYDQMASKLPEQAKPLPTYLPAEIIRQRPDLLAAEHRLKSQELKLLSSKKAWLPSLNFNASQGLQDQSLNNILKNGLSVSAVAFNLMQPLFNAGAIKAQQAQARAAVSTELYSYSELLHRAILEVDKLLQKDNVLKQQMNAAKFAANVATETQSLAQRDYNAGLTDLNTFLDTHRNTINTQTRLITVTNSWLQNRINLLLALGVSLSTKDLNAASIETFQSNSKL